MRDSYLLGIDTGTSMVKAALFDRRGNECTTAMRRTSLHSPQPGWSEVSMIEIWHVAAAAVRETLAAARIDGSAVAGVGVTGNMIGAWPIDKRGEPVRRAILWNDGRTNPLLERLNTKRPGLLAQIFSFCGSVMQQGCTLPLVRWLAEYEPETLERSYCILCCKDWIRFKLTGELATDPTDASGLPGNMRTQDYAPELFELLGISQYRSLFPSIVPSQAIAGHVTPEAAGVTGLRVGTPVVTGAGDVPAVALGAGAVEPGMACTILGTTCINGLVADQPIFEPANIGLHFYLPDRRWLRAFANIAGTTNLDWFIEQFCPAEQASAATQAELFALLEELAAESDVGARGLLYHPYLSAAGIIAPIAEPAARAQLFGLSIEHRRADVLRAVYEGVALAIRDCYTALDVPITEIRLSGGGARSALWGQIIADCTGARVVVPSSSELGARGAMLLAGVGIGWFASVGEAAMATAHIARTYDPNPHNHERYTDIYALYCDLRDRLQPVWRRRYNLEHTI